MTEKGLNRGLGHLVTYLCGTKAVAMGLLVGMIMDGGTLARQKAPVFIHKWVEGAVFLQAAVSRASLRVEKVYSSLLLILHMY